MQIQFISARMGIFIIGALIMDYNPTVDMFCMHTQLQILQLKSRNAGGFLSMCLVSQAALLHVRERLKFFKKRWKSFGQQLTEWMLISLTTLVLGITEVLLPITHPYHIIWHISHPDSLCSCVKERKYPSNVNILWNGISLVIQIVKLFK